MKDYIPELSELQMVRRAPDWPVDFGSDRDYIFSCVEEVERSFGLQGFPGCPIKEVSARALIKQLILWWRTLEPTSEAQQEAYSRMPGAIRLIDTISIYLADRQRPTTSL